MNIMKIHQVPFLLVLILNTVSCSVGNEDPTKKITVIELKNDHCNVYLKHIVWGITGDNSITYVSQNKDLNDTISEPYFRALDFFYRLDSGCVLNICKSDSLHRSNFSKVEMLINDDGFIDYSNYKKEGFDNILYH
jgi:hypothetical protein